MLETKSGSLGGANNGVQLIHASGLSFVFFGLTTFGTAVHTFDAAVNVPFMTFGNGIP